MKLLNKLTLGHLIVSLFVVVVAIAGIVTINSIDLASSIKTILFACLLTFAAAIILGVYISRTISEPIIKLKDAAVELGKGKLDTRVSIESEDEFGVLAGCFNYMASRLEQDITKRKRLEEELEKHREHLEELVNERTGELRENKVKYHTLYESSSDAIMMLDEEGFFDCNNATLAMFGFSTKEEFTKVHPSQVSPPNQPDGVDSMTAANIRIAEAFKKGKNFFEWIHRRNNGEDFPAEVLLTAFPLGEKQVLQATVRDITERKRAEEYTIEQERMATAIAELEFKALSGLNLNTLMNTACSLLVPTPGVEYCRVLELMPDGDLLPRAEIEFNKNIISSAISGKGTESLAGYTLLSGDTVIVEDLPTEMRFREPLLMERGIISGMSAIIGEPGAPYGVIGAHTTKQRVFTPEEIMFMETVANVLAQAIKRKHIEDSLKLAKDEALRANMVKTNFLMTMSHELRTPLNAVLGFSEVLKQKTAGELNEKQERYLDNITTGGNNLLNIINQILELVRTESEIAELQIENIPVHQTVDEVISSIKKKAQAKNVNIEKNIDPELDNIDADKYKFKQVFIILLDNAVKFSKKDGGTITIIAKKEGGMARFSVSDTGIGIKEEDIGKIFQKFTQLESGTTRKYGGTGIGLALAKQFVELHGGKISVESKPGVGSTFTFLLPIEAKKRGENCFK